MFSNDPDVPIAYAFEVIADDGRAYEVLVHEDGMAYRVPVAPDRHGAVSTDDRGAFVELPRAS
ncbi:MAG: hypothetical protein AAFX50_10465 [Acidobacteriota bacterium]